MKKVNAELSDLYLHSTEGTADPSNESSSRYRDDSGTGVCLSVRLSVRVSVGRSFITRIVVDLRPIDVIDHGIGGVDSSYFR
jgi:hypothetical protein